MQYWPILDDARRNAIEAFQTDFIYDNPTTYLATLAEAHATLQDQFADQPPYRDYWTARNAVLEIIFRTAMFCQDADHGDFDPETETPAPDVAVFLHAVGESATVWQTENPQYNHWDDFDAELSLWRQTLATEYALEPSMRDRTNLLHLLENLATAATMFAAHARFTKHDRDPHARDNFAVWVWDGWNWTERENHCDPGFTALPPAFDGNQTDETLCIPCQEYVYSAPLLATARAVSVPFVPTTPYHSLQIPTDEFGIVTGAHQVHYPTLAATALTANRYRIPLAIADHGLTPAQRREFRRFNVHWIDHKKPPIPKSMPPAHAVAEPNAYWKPWICEASPWDRTIWIDADAIACQDLRPALDITHPEPLLTTNDAFTIHSFRLYRDFHTAANLDGPPPDSDSHVTICNTGVLAWTRGETLLEEWLDDCMRLINSPHLHALANTRDQSAMYATLNRRFYDGQPLPYYLPTSWNQPADYLRAPDTKHRKTISPDPVKLLAQTIRRHPDAHIVHWLGTPKPAQLYR